MILLSVEDLKPDFLFNRAAETDIHEVRSWTSELTVLVVEDDEILQESFQQMLAISLQKLRRLLTVRTFSINGLKSRMTLSLPI